MCGMVGWFAAFFFFFFCFRLFFAATGAQKGPISLAPTECFVVVAPHVQKLWKEGVGGKITSRDHVPNRCCSLFFSVCFARRTACIALWSIMLQMPINRTRRIARKEAGEEDGGRASCAAAVHNTQLLAQVEDLCEHLKVED